MFVTVLSVDCRDYSARCASLAAVLASLISTQDFVYVGPRVAFLSDPLPLLPVIFQSTRMLMQSERYYQIVGTELD